MIDPSSVRLGFIGLGNVAFQHAESLEKEGLIDTIATGMDPNSDARHRFADTFSAVAYDDHEDMFGGIDAVMVTTPNKFHEQYVIDALDAGLDVFVEKPLAHTLESAERIAEVAHNADGFCMVGFHNRFTEPVRTLAAYRTEGLFGEISHIEANYIRRRGVPGRGSWFTRKSVAGGGSLIDIGAHAIDLALYMLDFPAPTEVTARTRAQFGTDENYSYVSMWGEDQGADEFTVDDSTSAFIRCENGSTISLEVAWAANRPSSEEYYIRGTDAGAVLDLGTEALTLFETATTGSMHHRTTDIETRVTNAHTVELERFIESVASGDPPGINTVDEALEVQRLMDAIYRSSEADSAVSIHDELEI